MLEASRREFLQAAIVAGEATCVWWLTSCVGQEEPASPLLPEPATAFPSVTPADVRSQPSTATVGSALQPTEVSFSPTPDATATLSPEQEMYLLERRLSSLKVRLEVSDEVRDLHGVIVRFTGDPAGDQLSKETITAEEGVRRMLLNTFLFATTRPSEPVVLPKEEVVKQLAAIISRSEDGLINGIDPVKGVVINVVPWNEAVREEYKVVGWRTTGAADQAVRVDMIDNQLTLRVAVNFDLFPDAASEPSHWLNLALINALSYVAYPEVYEMSVTDTRETSLMETAVMDAYYRNYWGNDSFPLLVEFDR